MIYKCIIRKYIRLNVSVLRKLYWARRPRTNDPDPLSHDDAWHCRANLVHSQVYCNLQSAIQSFIILNYVNCKMQNLCSFEICFNYVLCTFMDISQFSQNDHRPSSSTELWTLPPNIAHGQYGHSSKLRLGDGLKIIMHDRFFSFQNGQYWQLKIAKTCATSNNRYISECVWV